MTRILLTMKRPMQRVRTILILEKQNRELMLMMPDTHTNRQDRTEYREITQNAWMTRLEIKQKARAMIR